MRLERLTVTVCRAILGGVLVLADTSAELVHERWARVLRLGLRPEADAYPVGTSDAELLERRERLHEVLREGRDLLERTAADLAGGALTAVVADRDGVILSARTDRKYVDPMTRLRLVEGTRWGEEARGTNAIGTALVEGRAVAVVGGAHFEVRNRELFCYATPVRDAYGDIVAVLDVSGPIAHHDAAIGLAVQAAGIALESALRVMAYGERRSGALAAIERLVHRSAGPAMMIEVGGRARVINDAARRALMLGNDTRLTCERLFGVSFDMLVATAAGRDGIGFETRTGAWKVTVDPIMGDAGRPLAVLVHFEPALRVIGLDEKSAAAGYDSGRVTPLPSVAPSSFATDRSLERSARPGAAPPDAGFSAIFGEDPALQRAKQMAMRFAATALPVLVLAETGTGKELFARAIHEASAARDGAFVAVNCGALAPSLIASEIFGYAPGAFTGASRGGSEGRIGAAHGGTLFLDEVAEMPPELQAALLRVLDSGFYQRVGESRERRAVFRLICATCKNLPELVAEGHFRSDLYYRIQGACVTIPAVRDRRDVVWLAESLARSMTDAGGVAPVLSEEAAAFVASHDWPGNVRELKSAVAHAVALAAGSPLLLREHFPTPMVPRPAARADVPMTRKRIVRDAIESTLAACAGNVSEAARRLGVGRGTIYRAIRAKDEG